MATIYLEQGRFPEAEPLLRQVVAMDPASQVTFRQEQAQSESLLGLGLASQRLYARAEIEFTKAVALREASQGSRHPETGDELNNLGWTRIEQGKLAEARATMEKSLDILEQTRGVQDVSVARVLDGLARIDAEQNRLGDAETKYRRLITTYEAAGPDQKSRLDDGLKRYGELLDRMGRPADSAQVLARLANAKGGVKTDDNVNLVTPKSTAPPKPNSPGS